MDRRLPDIDDYLNFPNREIHTDDPHPLEKAPSYNQAAMDEAFQAFLKEKRTGAFVVLQHGKVIYEQYDEGLSQQTISGSFSMAKSITSLLVGKALELGWIRSLDEPVSHYLPEYNFSEDRRLTIRRLLTMSAGLKWDEKYYNPLGLPVKAYYGNDLQEVLSELRNRKEPGVEFEYQSISTQILAEILYKVSGKNLSQLLETFFWKPMQMESDARWSLDHEDGREKAFCCFNATARDYARLGQLLLQKGQWNGRQLISADYLKEAVTPASYLMHKGKPVSHYGYQFIIMNYKGHTVHYYVGHLGQFIFTIPDLDAVVVRLGHEIEHEFDDDGHYVEAYTFFDAGLNILQQQNL